MTLQQAIQRARAKSLLNPGCVIHVNSRLLVKNRQDFDCISVALDQNGYSISDWFCDGSTRIAIVDGRPLS